MTSRLLGGLATAALLAALAGCGPRLLDVQGTVTFDDEPVGDGNILFAPEDPTIGPTQAVIKNGQYRGKALEGKNTVRVTASKIRPGGARGAGGEPVAEDYIPEQFNTRSTLSADVKPSGPNRFDFPLKSKGK